LILLFLLFFYYGAGVSCGLWSLQCRLSLKWIGENTLCPISHKQTLTFGFCRMWFMISTPNSQFQS
jgi:hypothetical protein